MPSLDDRERRVEVEKLLLRALCQGARAVRESARRILSNYTWRESIHQAIFEAVISTPTADPQLLRDQLPARLTRKGFPDFDLGDLFEPVALSREEAESLMRRLTQGTVLDRP